MDGYLSYIWFYGRGQGTFYIDDLKLIAAKAETPTCVEEGLSPPGRPGGNLLERIGPNPFNGLIEVRYRLPHGTRVTVTVYDVLGRRVRTLWEGWQSGGNHLVRWDGRNDRGQEVSSGLYLVRITAGHLSGVGKVLLLR